MTKTVAVVAAAHAETVVVVWQKQRPKLVKTETAVEALTLTVVETLALVVAVDGK